MYLLNAHTLQLKLFLHEATRPQYAILSHTWCEGEEVTFEDLQSYHNAVAEQHLSLSNAIASRPGFRKIQRCCDIAVNSRGLEWAWVDTCCIDKRSSAELSEAINSMYKWYCDAAECFAFLQDATGSENDASFRNSRWFTRGWTLQEFIAPKRLSFYNHEWKLIGKMHEDYHLCEAVSSITLIPVAFLKGAPLSDACVAKKMSWASRRQTTRPEDVAYSLLGIFGINMPLLYGEGQNAFIRLQEEIINKTQDPSILTWGTVKIGRPGLDDFGGKSVGALATSPADFEDCGDFEMAMGVDLVHHRDFQVTPVGIKVGVILYGYMNCAVCEFSCFTCRFPSECVKVLLGPGPRMHGNLRFAFFSQYSRVGRNLWCKPSKILFNIWQTNALLMERHPEFFFISPLLYLYKVLSAFFPKRGYTITIAKDLPKSSFNPTHSNPGDQPFNHILLNLPKNHTLRIEYAHPSFSIGFNTHQLGQQSLRIGYAFEHDNPGQYGFRFNKYHWVVGLIYTLLRFWASVGIYQVPIYRDKTHLYYWVLAVNIPLEWIARKLITCITPWMDMVSEVAVSRVDSQAIRACIRITGRDACSPYCGANQVLVIICYQPSGWAMGLPLPLPNLTCHLVPVPMGRPHDGGFRITDFGRWPRVYGNLEAEGQMYFTHVRRPKVPLALNKHRSASFTILSREL